MTFDTAPAPFSDLLLGKRSQVSGGWPPFFISLGSQVSPQEFDGR
jgi:hypothetical protein